MSSGVRKDVELMLKDKKIDDSVVCRKVMMKRKSLNRFIICVKKSWFWFKFGLCHG